MVELERKALAADQLPIADLLVAGHGDAVGDLDLLRLYVEPFGGFRHQRLPRGRRGVAQLQAAGLDAEAAPGLALVRRERGVAFDDLHRTERHVQLVGGDLHQRGAHAGAEIDLAGIDRHDALGIDRQEGVHFGERQRFCRRRGLGERVCDRPGE